MRTKTGTELSWHETLRTVDNSATYTLPLTDIHVMCSAANAPVVNYVSCYTCGSTDFGAGLFNSGGVAVCIGCALKYEERQGIPATLILTDAQRAAATEWAGVGLD